MINKQDIVEMYLDGISLPDIGRHFGVSRQYAHQVIKWMGVHREHVNTLRRRNLFEIFDSNFDMIVRLRGQRASWSSLLSMIDTGMSEDMTKWYFKDWRIFRGINSMASGSGPDLRCPKCETVKPKDEFHNYRGHSNGKVFLCKECVRKYQNEHLDAIMASNKKYAEKQKTEDRQRKNK